MEGLSTTQTLINVAVQVANLVLFFFVFKYLIGDKITKALEERKALMKKLTNADATYEHIIADAHKESKKIVAEAADHRRRVVEESISLAEKKGAEVLDAAQRKASDVQAQAVLRTEQMERDLEKEFSSSVKYTSELVIKKLLGTDKKLEKEYIDTIVNELTHSS